MEHDIHVVRTQPVQYVGRLGEQAVRGHVAPAWKVKTTKYPKTKNRKTKKKSDAEHEGLIKEAQKATHVGGIVITVPLFISRLARVCINGMVSAGHDIEDMFEKLSKKWKLTDREKAELIQLLEDMNYPVRRDRGFLPDEEIDTSSSDNFDWSQNFRA